MVVHECLIVPQRKRIASLVSAYCFHNNRQEITVLFLVNTL